MSEIGEAELDARLTDIDAVKAGTMTLELAQKRSRKRQRQSGLTPFAFYQELTKATGRMRVNAVSIPSNRGGNDALRLLADLFSESVHETWTKEEIVNIIEDAIRLGSAGAVEGSGK